MLLGLLAILAVAGVAVALTIGGSSASQEPRKLANSEFHAEGVLSPPRPAPALALRNYLGQPVNIASYRGKAVLVTFLYTHCPDVCPLTMAHLHVVMQKLGKRADDARILFVSVDPGRDTPAILHAYVNAFDSHAVGLTGKPRAVEALVKRYRSAFTREPASKDGNYEVSHSSAIYVFDRDGNPRVLFTPAGKQDDLVHDLQLLLGDGSPT